MTPLLTVPEVAETLRASEQFVLAEIKRKHLRASKTGAGWRVSEGDLSSYVDARANLARVRGQA